MRMMPFIKKRDQGQVLVIFAVAIFALLILVGLAIDGAQLYLNYTRLKRAVDAAAVAAANDFKKGVSLDQMKQSAVEILAMQQVTDMVDINVYNCDSANIQTLVPDFYNQCPKLLPGISKKKLIYVQAFENSPTNFVTLIGIHSIPITTSAVSEAAPVDLVIVLDTSESMGGMTPGYNADFNPANCNAATTDADKCQPLQQAKAAAKDLINKLYPGYDRVAIVSFDTVAQLRYAMGDPSGAGAILDTNVPLHDDPYVGKLFPAFKLPDKFLQNAGFNPINPEDQNNDGVDPDTSIDCKITDPNGDRWDADKNIPCDDPNFLDAFNWGTDGNVGFSSGAGIGYACTPADSDTCVSQRWMADHNAIDSATGSPYNPPLPISVVSTCTGCGIRVATNVLVSSGRTNAVWVMVFLSDGVANMSDTSQTFPYDPKTKVGVKSVYPNGYCGGRIVINNVPPPDPKYPNYWLTYCQDNASVNPAGLRHCINSDSATCPLGSVALTASGSGYSEPYEPYSVLDYAKDQTDAAALRVSSNPLEKPTGNDIAIYTILFKSNPTIDVASRGAPLLRYMAAVGDDGNRDTDPCVTKYGSDSATPTGQCGQYYYAEDVNALKLVFRDIASRIYTKISE
jgi:Putative Flp pilus-assembly TadE/G-like